jgi:hypothetical protein
MTGALQPSGFGRRRTVELAGARVTAVAAAHELSPDCFGGYRFWCEEHGDHRLRA